MPLRKNQFQLARSRTNTEKNSRLKQIVSSYTTLLIYPGSSVSAFTTYISIFKKLNAPTIEYQSRKEAFLNKLRSQKPFQWQCSRLLECRYIQKPFSNREQYDVLLTAWARLCLKAVKIARPQFQPKFVNYFIIHIFSGNLQKSLLAPTYKSSSAFRDCAQKISVIKVSLFTKIS